MHSIQQPLGCWHPYAGALSQICKPRCAAALRTSKQPLVVIAGAFIAFINLLQNVLSAREDPEMVEVPIPPPDGIDDALAENSEKLLALENLKWCHPCFQEMRRPFSPYGEILAGKYAWKVQCVLMLRHDEFLAATFRLSDICTMC